MPRADLHVHTRYSPDCASASLKLVARCLERGLDCIAITDHNTIEGALETREIAPFTVIVGEEVTTTGGDIIGLFLREEVPSGLSPLEAVQCIKEQGGLVSIPHPFDRFRSSVIRPDPLSQVLPHVDIIETFNARNVLGRADRKAAEMASRHNIAACSVSDAHTIHELGRTYVAMPEFDGTAQGFLTALRQGTLVCHRSNPLVHAASSLFKLRRRPARTDPSTHLTSEDGEPSDAIRGGPGG